MKNHTVTPYRLVREGEAVDVKARKKFDTPKACYDLIKGFAAKEEVEVAWVLPLNMRKELLTPGPIVISRGSQEENCVTPALVFRPAIAVLATGVVLVHNHPGGTPDPSPMDDEMTVALRRAGDLVDVILLDHIIVADDGFFSYRKAKRSGLR